MVYWTQVRKGRERMRATEKFSEQEAEGGLDLQLAWLSLNVLIWPQRVCSLQGITNQ